jgi:cytochrome b561
LTVQQNLYVAFGPIGGACEILAIIFTWLTVFQRPRGSREARCSWIAAVAASVGLVVWAVVVAPMNTVLSSWTPESMRSDWTLVRDRWELGHATQAVLYAIAFITLALARHSAGPRRDRMSDVWRRVSARR